MKIAIDKHIPYIKGVLEPYVDEVIYLAGSEFTKESIADKDVLIVRTVTHFGEEILSSSKVKLICSATIGYDHIDTAYCEANNIVWKTAPGCNASSVEQYVTSSLMVMSEKLHKPLVNQTIGIVGVGNVGKKVAKACRLSGMRVLLNDPPRQMNNDVDEMGAFVSLEQITQEADVITFHTPLTKEEPFKTHHLADASFFRHLARRPIIINAARGGVVDNVALINGIKNNVVSGAVIDCWENEPNINTDLLALCDIATPHIAGYSADGKWMASKMSIDYVLSFLKINGTPSYYPIPTPESVDINLAGLSDEKQMAKAILSTYNPSSDDALLRNNPSDFSVLRSGYPLRREYNAFNLHHASMSLREVFLKFGFHLV